VVAAEPEFVLDAMDKSVETRTAPVQSVVVMECRTDLRQPVKFTWSRHGGIVPKNARVEGSKLTIPEVRAEDAGTYTCTARNSEESTEIPTILVVTGVVPYFAQAPISYMQMPTLPDAYQQFDIEVSFKPESPDGMILYNGQQAGGSGDFISFGLNNGIPEFRFDVGAGPAIIRGERSIEMGKWHTVKLNRNKKDGSMSVDGQGPFTGSVSGRFLGLDLLEPLFIGGVPNFRSIHRMAGFSRGFVGCISRLVVGNSHHELVRDATKSRGITTCETCALNPCLNGGVCQEAYAEHGYSCICPSGFSGLSCDKIGETCYPGACGSGRCVNTASGFDCMCPFGKAGVNCEREIVIYEPAFTDGSFLAYPNPTKSVLKKLRLTMRIKPHQVRDGLLAYSAQTEDGQGDFSSLTIKDRKIEFRYDSGSGPAILRSNEEVRAGEWLKVTAERTYREGLLILNDGPAVHGKSPGSTRGLNLNSRFYVGGWDRQKIDLNSFVNVSSSFHGCLSQFELQGEEVDLVNSVVDSANIEDCGGASACERRPCLNGGVCNEYGGSGLGDFTCQCEDGFSGKTCEIEADLCQVIHPCQNGGSCIGTYNAYKCNCPLGYGGANCERSVEISEEAFFQGDSYVEIDKSLLPHVSTNASEVFIIEFSTSDANGLLFWNGQKPETAGHGQDYIALSVVNGRLEFSYELGSGPAQITTAKRVDDGFRHRVVAKRTTRQGSLELDGVQENGLSPQGNHQMLNTKGNIYIGGLPNADWMTAGRYTSNFKGCIHSVQIQDSGVLNFNRAAVSAINVVPCSSDELLGEEVDDEYEPPAN